ncbi:semaphorin-3B isoform X2 [Carettochelys insculpta]|uniref:semaphorin-3B isoform X2 n=1 Tax=Carettochelys insculpta TaxID=44489 RepID=UPI003EBB401F
MRPAGSAGPAARQTQPPAGEVTMVPTLLQLLLLWLLGAGGRMDGSQPRLRLSFQELKARHGLRTYGLERSCCYEALLLDEERGRLFVGGKNYLASLSLDNISKQDQKIYWPAPVEWREECNWAGKDINAECMNFVKILHLYNRTHLLACGTGAFHPTCAYVEVGQRLEEPVFRLDPAAVEDGKGKSPYDPRHTAASVLVGEELYAGVATDLMGRDFTIFRSLGPRPSIRTEQHDSRWLNEPRFVDVFWIPESENPDDDKIYFFFRETAVEGPPGLGKSSFARVGQICRNDLGGQRSLVNKWTTFLKARLVCAVPGSDGGDTFFDELRDVFLLRTKDMRNPLVYAVFSTSSSVFRGSAVCLYNMRDIRRAFLGPFAHKEGPSYQWVSFQGRVPYPRPGMCPSKTFGTFSSTKDFPDDVIQFARNHPLMASPVLPQGRRPLFLQTAGAATFTRIAVDRVAAADGHYDVLFIGTDIGTVLKVVSVPKESWQNMEELLLEELQVFKDSSPVTSMQLSSKRLYVGSPSALAQLPLHRCWIYGKGCAECCLARDPYCAWNGTSCTRYMPNTKRSPAWLRAGEAALWGGRQQRVPGVCAQVPAGPRALELPESQRRPAEGGAAGRAGAADRAGPAPPQRGTPGRGAVPLPGHGARLHAGPAAPLAGGAGPPGGAAGRPAPLQAVVPGLPAAGGPPQPGRRGPALPPAAGPPAAAPRPAPQVAAAGGGAASPQAAHPRAAPRREGPPQRRRLVTRQTPAGGGGGRRQTQPARGSAGGAALLTAGEASAEEPGPSA